jgi:carboxypeptidase T
MNFSTKFLSVTISFSALFFSAYYTVSAQENVLLPSKSITKPVQKYSRARIYYDTPQQFMALASQGLPLDHGTHKQNYYFESDFSANEIAIARMMGLQVDIIIDDVSQYYVDRNNPNSEHFKPATTANGETKNATCGPTGSVTYPTPTNWELGSMGGFYTYAEMLAELDQMAALYPNLITVKAPISTFLTTEGRPIYFVKISDNPNVAEAEPQVLYDAIHHAREPVSMQQLIFYMWYLLENYATDVEVQNIVNNAELYFIPVLNPDGYVFNETANPNGGGMWRKNRRNNGGGNFGVDNNRNYDYAWNTTGVSSNPGNDTYPGTAAFSEVENQAMKWFCENHNFKIAMNNHSYDNSLLYPFGYATAMLTPDNAYIEAATAEKVKNNGLGMVNKLSSALYPASGDSDDWMYDGDLATKPKIFAYTPEIGNDSHGFWPASADIETVCESMVYTNLTTAKLVLNYATLADASPLFINQQNDYFKYNVQRLGLDNPGDFTVSINPISSNILTVGSPNNHLGMNMMEVQLDSISYTLDPAITFGDIVTYEIVVNNGLYDEKITVSKTYGTATVVYSNNASSMSEWTATSTWNVTTTDYYSAPSSITDSPSGNYTSNANNNITLNPTIDLTNTVAASVTFYAKWDIEDNYDYVQFQVSTNGGANWISQCGNYTNIGSSNQSAGNPLYDGTQLTWVKEEIDLSDYLGQQVKFRFRLRSDWGDNRDGFYFDDFTVNAVYSSSGIDELTENSMVLFQNIPNPTSSDLTIQYLLPSSIKTADLVVYNEMGQLVFTTAVSNTERQINLSIDNLSSGVYFYHLQTNDQRSETKMMVVSK